MVPTRKRYGFSLPEVVAVMALIGILASVAITTGATQRDAANTAVIDATLRDVEREARQIAGGRSAAAGAARATAVPPPDMPSGVAVAAIPPDGTLPWRLIWLDAARDRCRTLLLPDQGNGTALPCDANDGSVSPETLADAFAAEPPVALETEGFTVNELTLTSDIEINIDPDGGTYTVVFNTPQPDVNYRIWEATSPDGPWRPVGTTTSTWTSPRIPANQQVNVAVSAFTDIQETERVVLTDEQDVTTAAQIVVPAGPIQGLTAEQQAGTVSLSWTIPDANNQLIAVLRGPDLVATLMPSTTSWVDVAPPAGEQTYTVGYLESADASELTRPQDITVTVGGSAASPVENLTINGNTLTWSPPAGTDIATAQYIILRDGVRHDLADTDDYNSTTSRYEHELPGGWETFQWTVTQKP